MPFLLIYITHPDQETADRLSDGLVNQKLVACANCFPITSAYWWQGTIAREGEWVSLVKTPPEKWLEVVAFIEANHPYELPCIMRMKVAANERYEEWIRTSVSD